MSRPVLVPPERLHRWLDNFAERHGGSVLGVSGGALVATGADGRRAVLRASFDRHYDGVAAPDAFAAALSAPGSWGVLLVRRGGFAVARLAGEELVASKVGSRHVQGRSKAGGQSQQRFARRRSNQARQSFEAAADHAARVLGSPGSALPGRTGPSDPTEGTGTTGRTDATTPLTALVCGGDRAAVQEVLEDPRLADVATVRATRWLAVADPRRAVLEQAVRDARAVAVELPDGE